MDDDNCEMSIVQEFDYTLLNTHYEAKEDMIIEWNKDADNAQYTDFKQLEKRLNYIQMNWEDSRERIFKLSEKNEKLTEENKQLKEFINELEREKEVLKFQIEAYRQREMES